MTPAPAPLVVEPASRSVGNGRDKTAVFHDLDGSVDGVVNLYVIDDVSRMPISGAAVRIGSLDGTTDSTGLFVATDVTGPQTITAKASGYRAEVWVGANGANVTIDLQKANDPTPPTANLSGQIANWSGVTVAAGHAKVGVVAYSQSDNLSDAANNIAQPNNQSMCITIVPTSPSLVTGRIAQMLPLGVAP